MLWFGKVSADGNNFGDLRLLGQVDGVAVRVQLYDVNVTPGDVLTLELAGRTWRVPYTGDLPETGGWNVGERCTNGICRGWSADGLIPWSEFGGRPHVGETWPLRVVFDDADTAGAADRVTSQAMWPPSGAPGGTGTLHWGLPEYGGQERSRRPGAGGGAERRQHAGRQHGLRHRGFPRLLRDLGQPQLWHGGPRQRADAVGRGRLALLRQVLRRLVAE